MIYEWNLIYTRVESKLCAKVITKHMPDIASIPTNSARNPYLNWRFEKCSPAPIQTGVFDAG